MSRWPSLIVFLVAVLVLGIGIGYLTLPGEWYAGLNKPPFNPPNWVFGPVWTILYILVAVAGWRTWTRAPSGTAMNIWWVQMVLNFLWSPAFFALHVPALALVVVLAMLVAILAFIGVSWSRDRLAAWLFVPYAAWVAFASLLNASVWWLN